MQQRHDAFNSQRTQPAVPEMTLPTHPALPVLPALPALARSTLQKRVIEHLPLLPFLCLGILIEACLLALLPLFALLAQPRDTLLLALSQALPWVPLWTTHPGIVRLLPALPWLSLHTSTGPMHLVGALLAVALLCAVLAALLGRLLTLWQGTWQHTRALCLLVCIGSALFGLTLLFVPVGLSPFTRDMALYGLYGRIVTVYHLNPYAFAPTAVQHDALYPLVGQAAVSSQAASYGPVWLDLCLFVTLLAGNSVARVLLGFRLLGLIAHVANVLLFWRVLGKVKPEMWLMGTLLYAWNPLVLLFSVLFMHQEAVLVLCLLLAVFFLQRESPTLGWVLLLLAALMSTMYLLLLPLFVLLLLHESRILYLGRSLLWWLGMGSISVVVMTLAYAPYDRGESIAGLLAALGRLFAPVPPINSLAATLLNLPIALPAPLHWLLAPQHWMLLALLVGVCMLLLGLWAVDTLGMALLFSCWLLLLGVVLLPVYWPWYVLPPLALALCSGNRSTILFTVLLVVGGLLSCYYWLWPSPWLGQGLLTLALPLVLWGWLLFFLSTWQMVRPPEPEKPAIRKRTVPSFSRPSWLSRPSRPGRG